MSGFSDAFGQRLGLATISKIRQFYLMTKAISLLNPQVFYAIAYDWNGETIILYAGRTISPKMRLTDMRSVLASPE